MIKTSPARCSSLPVHVHFFSVDGFGGWELQYGLKTSSIWLTQYVFNPVLPGPSPHHPTLEGTNITSRPIPGPQPIKPKWDRSTSCHYTPVSSIYFACFLVHSRKANSPLPCWEYSLILQACIILSETLDGDILQPMNSSKSTWCYVCLLFGSTLLNYINLNTSSLYLFNSIIECDVHSCSRSFKVGPDPTNNGDLCWRKMSMHDW